MIHCTIISLILTSSLGLSLLAAAQSSSSQQNTAGDRILNTDVGGVSSLGRDKAIIPTVYGQIGVNPVSIW